MTYRELENAVREMAKNGESIRGFARCILEDITLDEMDDR